MFYQEGAVRLQSKTGKDCTEAFPEIHNPEINAGEAIFDGELTVLSEGRPDFEGVMERYHSGIKKARLLAARKPSVYIVWDILWHDGENKTRQPLSKRKKYLEKILNNSTHIRKIDWIDEQGTSLWEAVVAHDLEGIVAKSKNSFYEAGKKSSAWLKIKNYREESVNIFGYSFKEGAVLVGPGDNVRGHAIGINAKDRSILRDLLDKYGTTSGEKIYLPPGIRGRVRFTGFTPSGSMRDCTWKSFET